MEAVVLERLDAVAQAVAADELPQLPPEVGDSILALRRDVEQVQTEMGASGSAAAEATSKWESAFAGLEATVAETTAAEAALRHALRADPVSTHEASNAAVPSRLALTRLAACRDEVATLTERVGSKESGQEVESQELRDSVEAAIARTEDAVAARVEALDDLGAAQGAKLLRVASVVDEWEAMEWKSMDEWAARASQAGVDAASEALQQMQAEVAAAAEAAIAPFTERLNLAEQSSSETAAELTRRLDEQPWAHALELSDEVDALRSELAVSISKGASVTCL